MQKDFVFLVEKEEWEKDQDMILNAVKRKSQSVQIIPEQQVDYQKLLDNYDLYEFTDKLVVLREHPSYSSMKKYVEQGIISEEEMIEALLYKIN